MYIYQRIKDLREDADLTQADIAPILQTTREQYKDLYSPLCISFKLFIEILIKQL